MGLPSSLILLPLLLASPALCASNDTSDPGSGGGGGGGGGDQFSTFFPGWSSLLLGLLSTNCSSALTAYHADPSGQPRWDLVDCLLGSFSPSRAAEAAAAALTLGIAPSILYAMGASSPAELAALAFRRPALALLLAVANPTPGGDAATGWADPVAALRRARARARTADADRGDDAPEAWWRPALATRAGGRGRWPVVVAVAAVQYALAGVAAANVGLLAFQLGHWDFFSSANNAFDTALWTYTALLIHLCGMLVMNLRAKAVTVQRRGGSGGGAAGWERDRRGQREVLGGDVVGAVAATQHPARRAWTYLRSAAAHELTPALYGEPLQLRRRRPSPLSLLGAWVMWLAPTLQVVFGTIVLSGSLLMNHADAKTCLLRYLVSGLAVRLVLSFELRGLQEAAVDGDETGAANVQGSVTELGNLLRSRSPDRSMSRETKLVVRDVPSIPG